MLKVSGVGDDDVVTEGERIDMVDVTEVGIKGIAKGLRFGGLDCERKGVRSDIVEAEVENGAAAVTEKG